MAGWTNRGKYLALSYALRAATRPTNFYVALLAATIAPTADTNTMSDVSEIPAGNGYTSGGYQLTPGATDFDVLTEDDANDRGLIQVKDVVWTASGGPIPASGLGARYAVLTDDNATVASRQIFYYWDLSDNRIVSATQTLTLQNLEVRINES